MVDKIQFKRTTGAGKVPTPSQLAEGELAINLNDRKLYTKNHEGIVINIGADAADQTFLRQEYEETDVKGKTVFYAEYSNDAVSGAPLIDVLYNGIELSKSDYTAEDGRTITLKSAIQEDDDVVKIKAYRNGDVYDITAESLKYTSSTDKTLKDVVDGKSDSSDVVHKRGDTMSGMLDMVGSGSTSGDDSGQIKFTNPVDSSGVNNDSWINKNTGLDDDGKYVITNKLSGTTEFGKHIIFNHNGTASDTLMSFNNTLTGNNQYYINNRSGDNVMMFQRVSENKYTTTFYGGIQVNNRMPFAGPNGYTLGMFLNCGESQGIAGRKSGIGFHSSSPTSDGGIYFWNRANNGSGGSYLGSWSTSTLDVFGRVKSDTGCGIQGVGFGNMGHGNAGTLYEAIQLQSNFNLRFFFGSTQRFIFLNTGEAQCIRWNSTSDKQFKENIKPLDLTDASALDKIEKLNPVTWTWKKSYSDDTKTNMGFIAQELREVIPEAVTSSHGTINNETKEQGEILSMESTPIVAMLVQSIKELRAEIKELEGKIK